MALLFTRRAFYRIVTDYLSLRSRLQLVLCVTLCVNAVLVLCAARFIGVNTSPSTAPVGFYWRTAKPPVRGDLIEVCLPSEVAEFGQQRGYIGWSWKCPDGSEPVGKILLGLPGDLMQIDPSLVLKQDSLGRPLGHFPSNEYRLKPDEVWLYGTAKNSWDSRYFGPVPAQNIIANLSPIWTW